MVTDPVADLLIRIKNGYLAEKKQVHVPYSTMKERVVAVLIEKGYIKGSVVQKVEGIKTKEIVIDLKYVDGKPAMENVKRISKPGIRIYVDRHNIPYVMTGLGSAILSTSKGVMSDTAARKARVGGEVLCHIW